MSTSSANPNQLGILLRCRDVVNLVGLARSTIYVLVKNGEFPSAIQVSPRAVRWLASEVNAWVDSRIVITRPTVMLASCASSDAVGTQSAANQPLDTRYPASQCSGEGVKAKQGLTTLTEVGSWTAPVPASIALVQARDTGRFSRQGAR